jgi:hypothetical protein
MSSDTQYIKILTQDLKRRTYQWRIGLNEIDVFDTTKDCTSDALYVCEIKDFFKWMTLYDNMACVGYVKIPEDAQTVIMKNKIKSNKVILNEHLIPLIDFIDIAIKNRTNIKSDIDNALAWASENGYIDIVECLISHGADVHALDDCAIRYATRYGHLAVVEFLIAHGANIHILDDYPIRSACYNGYLDIIKCLIKYGANIHKGISLASPNIVELIEQFQRQSQHSEPLNHDVEIQRRSWYDFFLYLLGPCYYCQHPDEDDH